MIKVHSLNGTNQENNDQPYFNQKLDQTRDYIPFTLQEILIPDYKFKSQTNFVAFLRIV